MGDSRRSVTIQNSVYRILYSDSHSCYLPNFKNFSGFEVFQYLLMCSSRIWKNLFKKQASGLPYLRRGRIFLKLMIAPLGLHSSFPDHKITIHNLMWGLTRGVHGYGRSLSNVIWSLGHYSLSIIAAGNHKDISFKLSLRCHWGVRTIIIKLVLTQPILDVCVMSTCISKYFRP